MRPWENFTLMVAVGLLAGLATGGVPGGFAQSVSTAALVTAMTLSLTEIRFRGISAREESRSFVRVIALNYGALSGLILALSFLYAGTAIRNGWIVMAAVPSAIAVIPITSALRGNVQRALVSSAFLYVAALALVPLITLAFAGRAANPADLAVQISIQIGIPMAVSRPLARIPTVQRHRPVLVNVSFFTLVFALAGANRLVFVQDPGLVLALAGGGFVRTWVVGALAYALSRRASRDRAQHISDSLFASVKNLGLAALLGFSLFGPIAALPAIISIFLEVSWIVVLGRRFA